MVINYTMNYSNKDQFEWVLKLSKHNVNYFKFKMYLDTNVYLILELPSHLTYFYQIQSVSYNLSQQRNICLLFYMALNVKEIVMVRCKA